MLGSVGQVAQRYDLEISLELGPDDAILPEILSRPIECLQNPLDTYGLSLENVHPAAEMLVTLRETAGPFIGFIDDAAAGSGDKAGILVGRYRQGEAGVQVSWRQ